MIDQILRYFYKLKHPEAALNRDSRSPKITVSITTIPPRIKKVQQVIIRLLEQTVRPDRIVIYLGKDQFKGIELPGLLKAQMALFGVEVRYVEDIGPHTKYWYAIQEFPEDLVITADDDIRYPIDLIEELYESYKRHPKCVSARRCHLITFDENNVVKKYNEWKHKYSEIVDTPSMLLFPTGVGGVLYPPKVLHPEVLNLEILKKLSLKNDDIWLKFMEILNNTPVVTTKPFTIKHVKGSQKVALNQQNVAGGKNDSIIADLVNHYDEFYGKQDTVRSRMRREEKK